MPAATSLLAERPAARPDAALPGCGSLLSQGGDARIMPDPTSGLTRYGCGFQPDPRAAAFGSSTASTISGPAFSAASGLWHRLRDLPGDASSLYAVELDRQRQTLTRLCGLTGPAAPAVLFAASGTDLHLLAAQLVAAGAGRWRDRPLHIVMLDPAETGSGVPAALTGRHFSDRTAQDQPVTEGTTLPGLAPVSLITLAGRDAAGQPRGAAELDGAIAAQVERAIAGGGAALLILVDQSKTGMIAPSPATARALQARWPGRITVLVDGCQFRLSSASLRSYLAEGWLVGVTGSKFLTGPTFAGALLIPEAAPGSLGGVALPPALGAYSVQAEWPAGWPAALPMGRGSNFGLLLRWEAALAEFEAFAGLPQAAVTNFLRAFADLVQGRLAADPGFDPLPVARLERGPVAADDGWDAIPTIFPFRLRHTGPRAAGRPFTRDETLALYRRLLLTEHCQLGQPVHCGSLDGIPVSALRICASARLTVQAAAPDGQAAVLNAAGQLLDRVAALTRA